MTQVDQNMATQLLTRLRNGDKEAAHDLLALVQEDLRRMAHQHMRRQAPGHTLQTTALINEAVLKLLPGLNNDWRDKAHFVTVASRAMRQVLVDHARARDCAKRRANGARVPLDDLVEDYERRAMDLEALDSALSRLEERDPRLAQLVELRFFGGLRMEEAAKILGFSLRTAEREWRTARDWLRAEVE